MSQQHFCFRWNNYQANMSQIFQNMLFNENMVDVTIACEGASLKAHKIVLAACSPFFQSLFMSNPCKHPIVILKDIRFVDLKATIDFMYKGEVNVSQDQLSALLKTAETLRVKGLSDITEKQARAQHPQFSELLFSKSKKRKRNRNKSSPVKEGESEASSDSDDDSKLEVSRLALQRIIPLQKDDLSAQELELSHQTQQESEPEQELTSQFQNKDEKNLIHLKQAESSKILEESIATAEVDGTENGQDVVIASDVHVLTDDETLKQVALLQENLEMSHTPILNLPGPSVSTFRTPARRLMMSEAQRSVLRNFLERPIASFDVDTDESKKSIVWQYFGELAYRDPETGKVSIIDRDRHYCSKCIAEHQERNPQETFEKCNICFLSNGTATGNHKNHLRVKHRITDEQQRLSIRSSKMKKRPSKVMIISLDDLVAIDN